MKHSVLLSSSIGLMVSIFVASCDNSVETDYNAISTIKYSQHVQPLLNRSCSTASCHDVSARAAGLSLASWHDLIKGSNHGEVIVPAHPSRSLLTRLFDGTALRKQHPTMQSSLSEIEINFLKRWITEGCKNDQGQVPYEHSTRKVYVPNQGEDNVAIIDVASLVVCKYVDVGSSPAVEGPHFTASDGIFWYVSLIGSGEVWKFDAHTDTVVKIAHVPGAPALLALTPDGSKLYVSQFTTSSTNKVIVVNTATMEVQKLISVWTMPHGIRMNHAGTRVYVANMMSDNISVIDVARDSVIGMFMVGVDANPFGPPRYMPMEIAVSPNDSLIAVSCSETREVRAFDAFTYEIVESFQVEDQPWHLEFTPNGDFCYVTNRRGNSVSVIHIPMRHVMETLSTPSAPKYFDYPHGCDITSDGSYTFVSNENSGHGFVPRYNLQFVGNVCIIDNTLNQVIKVLEVGEMPTGLSISP
ncbi:MAG: beta-propeller fold lactonase family protein [Ignavibacteriae bacterium]|nr:beta-propeller fold lactonase family protein [Ignavibacteriota bacterium]